MYSHEISDQERSYEARKVTWIGFVANVILTVIKIATGILGHSSAMVADGIHSLSDFFTDIVVIIGLKLTEKPADEDHNFGHGKYETFAAVVVGIALLFAGYNIMQKGVVNIYRILILNETVIKPSLIAIFAALLSIVSKEMLYRYTKRVGEKINSAAVIANGWHHRSDAYSSVGTLIGISCAYILGNKWIIFDPIAAIVVSILIIKVAFEILSPSVKELLEASLCDEEVQQILNLIKETPEIVEYHDLRTRRIGTNVAIEAHILFEKSTSLYYAHEISESLEKKLRSIFGAKSIITFHLEPQIKKYSKINEKQD